MKRLSDYKWLGNRFNIAQFIKDPLTLDDMTIIITTATRIKLSLNKGNEQK